MQRGCFATTSMISNHKTSATLDSLHGLQNMWLNRGDKGTLKKEHVCTYLYIYMYYIYIYMNTALMFSLQRGAQPGATPRYEYPTTPPETDRSIADMVNRVCLCECVMVTPQVSQVKGSKQTIGRSGVNQCGHAVMNATSIPQYLICWA